MVEEALWTMKAFSCCCCLNCCGENGNVEEVLFRQRCLSFKRTYLSFPSCRNITLALWASPQYQQKFISRRKKQNKLKEPSWFKWNVFLFIFSMQILVEGRQKLKWQVRVEVLFQRNWGKCELELHVQRKSSCQERCGSVKGAASVGFSLRHEDRRTTGIQLACAHLLWRRASWWALAWTGHQCWVGDCLTRTFQLKAKKKHPEKSELQFSWALMPKSVGGAVF